MKTFFLILFLSTLNLYSQDTGRTKFSQSISLGVYRGSSFLNGNCWTITLKKNRKFDFHFIGQRYINNDIEFSAINKSGHWKINGDTLILKMRQNLCYKYIIEKSKLYEVPDGKTLERVYLEKE